MTSIRKKFLPGILLMVSLFFISGCAITSSGRMSKIKRDQVDALRVGVSTKEDVIAMLGKPQKIVYKPNKVEVFVYVHGIERRIGIPFFISWSRGGGTGQKLNIVFDQYGTVIDYEYTTDERGLIE